MCPIFIVELLTDDGGAHQRRRDEEWRAWHRVPDAAPPDDDPPPEPRAAPGIGLRLASIAAHLPLANRDGDRAGSVHRVSGTGSVP